MELRQLRYFVRIIETGSMGSAAQDLDIGVSALSQQMSRLENELAIRLLQRTSRGVTPTNAGLAFYSQAQLALRHADDAILAAREARLSGHVSVGMAPSTASILGIPFIHAMQENYADVRLHVVESLSGNLERMINTRQIDLAVVFQKDKILRWSARPILEEQLFLIAPMPCWRRFLITRSHLNNWQAFRSLCQARDMGCAAGWTLSARNMRLTLRSSRKLTVWRC